MAGHSRSKNGVASLAYDPAIHAVAEHGKLVNQLYVPRCSMDTRVKTVWSSDAENQKSQKQETAEDDGFLGRRR
jgi:hypothetical protein